MTSDNKVTLATIRTMTVSQLLDYAKSTSAENGAEAQTVHDMLVSIKSKESTIQSSLAGLCVGFKSSAEKAPEAVVDYKTLMGGMHKVTFTDGTQVDVDADKIIRDMSLLYTTWLTIRKQVVADNAPEDKRNDVTERLDLQFDPDAFSVKVTYAPRGTRSSYPARKLAYLDYALVKTDDDGNTSLRVPYLEYRAGKDEEVKKIELRLAKNGSDQTVVLWKHRMASDRVDWKPMAKLNDVMERGGGENVYLVVKMPSTENDYTGTPIAKTLQAWHDDENNASMIEALTTK